MSASAIARANANAVLAEAKAAMETLQRLHEACYAISPEEDDDPYSPLTEFLSDLANACGAAAELAAQLPEPFEGEDKGKDEGEAMTAFDRMGWDMHRQERK